MWQYAAEKIFQKPDAGRADTGDIERFHREYPDYGNDAQWKEDMSEKLGTLPEEFDVKYRKLHEKVEEVPALHKKYHKALAHCDRLQEGKAYSILTFLWKTMEEDPLLRLLIPLMKEQIHFDSSDNMHCQQLRLQIY